MFPVEIKTPLTIWPQTPIEVGNPIQTAERMTRIETETVALRNEVKRLETKLEKQDDAYKKLLWFLICILASSTGGLFVLLAKAYGVQ